MTVKDALSWPDIDNTDKELILAHVLKESRTWVLAHPDDEMREEDAEAFVRMAERRRLHEPLAYITGWKEFYGRMFRVTEATLIPRPATEILIEQAMTMINGTSTDGVREADHGIVVFSHMFPGREKPAMIADIGTGSGCIAVTLACEIPDVRITATDMFNDTLGVARENAKLHNVGDRITFTKGDLLEPLKKVHTPFLLVSNPPYIPDDTNLDADVTLHEPHAALFSGTDGRDVIARLLTQAQENPFCSGFVIECRTEQAHL